MNGRIRATDVTVAAGPAASGNAHFNVRGSLFARVWNASPAIRLIGGVAAGLSLLACAPAAASASTLYVSEHPSAPGNSCAHAGFKEIQTAIDEADTIPGTTIKICGGTYAEQLEITGEISVLGTSGAKVTLPAVIKSSGTACDLAVDAGVTYPDEDLLSICTPGTVKLSRLTLEAKFPSDGCGENPYNTMVGGGATLEATKVAFVDAGVEKGSVDSGCQGGVGIEVGVSGEEGSASVSKPALEVGHAVLTRDTITEYQKNGITVDGDGSSAVIGGAARSRRVTITGDGPENQGQNGIQVSRGAVASIGNVTISGNECNIEAVCGYGSASEWEEDASGVLFYLPGATSTVQKSTLSENNIGIEYISGMPTRPAAPEVALTNDKVSGGYASVQINQGNVAMKGDRLAGGLFAIDVNENEYGGGFGTLSAYAPDATSTSDFLEGAKASIQVEPSVGALEGKLTLSGDSVVGPVVNTGHANFKITG